MSNPFANAEAWDLNSGDWLGVGDHVCEVLEVDGSGTSSGGYPQIELKVGNAQGQKPDWIVITPNTVGKVAQIIQALGVAPPADNQVDPSNHRIAQAYLATWVGKKVGVVIREEDDFRDPTKKFPKIKGYVPASQIAPQQAQAAAPAGQPAQASMPVNGGAPAPQNAVNDTIPF